MATAWPHVEILLEPQIKGPTSNSYEVASVKVACIPLSACCFGYKLPIPHGRSWEEDQREIVWICLVVLLWQKYTYMSDWPLHLGIVTFTDQIQLVDSFPPSLMLKSMHAHIRVHVVGPVHLHFHALFPPAKHDAMVRFGVYGWFLAKQRSSLWRCLGNC
ncbi:hypothetical protein HDV63DRAFT_61740 [Trichoderma sp. SZMC 28014]